MNPFRQRGRWFVCTKPYLADESFCHGGAGAFYALVALLLSGAPETTAAHVKRAPADVTSGGTTMGENAETETKLGRELARIVQRHVALTHKSPKLL